MSSRTYLVITLDKVDSYSAVPSATRYPPNSWLYSLWTGDYYVGKQVNSSKGHTYIMWEHIEESDVPKYIKAVLMICK